MKKPAKSKIIDPYTKELITIKWAKGSYLSGQVAIVGYWLNRDFLLNQIDPLAEGQDGKSEPFFWELYIKLSLWQAESENIPPNSFFVKDYSENELVFRELEVQLGNPEFPFQALISASFKTDFPLWEMKEEFEFYSLRDFQGEI